MAERPPAARPLGVPRLALELIEGRLSICRLAPGAPRPEPPPGVPFWSLTRTPDELSLVVPAGAEPPGAEVEGGWRAVRVGGQLDFGLTGILSALTAPLAAAEIGLFALSTYDTDYLLVRETALTAAAEAWTEAGFTVTWGARAGAEGPAA